MKTNTFLRMICGTTLFITAGCTHHVFSPPANIAPAESVAVAQPGDTRIGGFATAQKLGFGTAPQTSTASLRVRQGLGHNLEVGLDGSFTSIDTALPSKDDAAGDIGSARVSGKWSPMGNYFALTAGFGGGTHTGGQFIAPDLGITGAMLWDDKEDVSVSGFMGGIDVTF